jgi:hypothetical protein
MSYYMNSYITSEYTDHELTVVVKYIEEALQKWETKWSAPWFDCDKSLTWRCLNSNLRHFGCFTFILVSCGESCLLVSLCAGGRGGMTCSDEDCGRSRRPGAEDRRWSHRLGTRWPGDREVEWRRVRSAPYTWRWEAWVSWLSLKSKIDGFLWFILKIGGDGFPGLNLKTSSSDLVIWVSKSSRWFFGLSLKTKQASVAP